MAKKKKSKEIELKKDSNVVIKDPEDVNYDKAVDEALNILKEYCKSNRADCSKCMYSTLIYNEALGLAHAFCDVKNRRPEDCKTYGEV